MAVTQRIEQLKSEALSSVAAADTTAVLEGVRVRFLGRSAELTQIKKSIGTLSPEERKVVGRSANLASREIEGALGSRTEELAVGRARGPAAGRGRRRHVAGGAVPARAPAPNAARYRRGRGLLRRPRLQGRRRTRGRDRLLQLHRAEHTAVAPGAKRARHVLPGRGAGLADAHVAGPDPDDARPGAARLRGVPGPHLPAGLRPDPHARCSTRSKASQWTGASPWRT